MVISPLVSLMMDQKAKFLTAGVSTEFVGEAQTDNDAIRRVTSGVVQLVFISPESIIENPRFRNMLLSRCYRSNLVASMRRTVSKHGEMNFVWHLHLLES